MKEVYNFRNQSQIQPTVETYTAYSAPQSEILIALRMIDVAYACLLLCPKKLKHQPFSFFLNKYVQKLKATKTFLIAREKSFFLGLNIRSLRYHHGELILLLKTLHADPALILIPETWLSENDSIEDIENYHPFESVPISNLEI